MRRALALAQVVAVVRVLAVVLALVLVLVLAPARPAIAAESAPAPDGEPAPSGLRVAVRSGVALPIGAIYDASGPLSATVTGYVPMRLDVGFRFALQRLYVGAAGQLAAIVPNACTGAMKCGGSDARIAAMFALHLLPSRAVDPWIGVGIGYETFSLSREAEGVKVDLAASGIELVDVDAGVDLRPSPHVRLGPVVSATLSRFTSVSVNNAESQDFDPMLHSWILFGLRGAYDL
jgi:hypothetical protein